jgi:hypothetical protein
MKRNQIPRVLKLAGIIVATGAGLILLYTGVESHFTESSRPTPQSGVSPWEQYYNRQRGWTATRNIGIGLAVLGISTFGAGWIASCKLTKNQTIRG